MPAIIYTTTGEKLYGNGKVFIGIEIDGKQYAVLDKDLKWLSEDDADECPEAFLWDYDEVFGDGLTPRQRAELDRADRQVDEWRGK